MISTLGNLLMYDVTSTNLTFFKKTLKTTPLPIWNKCLFQEVHDMQTAYVDMISEIII
jgi:hypothetical protein